MLENLTAFTTFFSLPEHQLATMFISAFLSSTVLPGNSEIIFSTFASQQALINRDFLATPIMLLLLTATIGNSLGSLTTYWLAMFFPKPQMAKHRYFQWALEKSERYGAIILLLSWLPIVGDLFCGIAGWLRLKFLPVVICIVIGKLVRYVLLMSVVYPIFS